MHIAKDYDERKNEFLDTAMGLFLKVGYDDTSVNAIIDAVGVSKGAFYHYFKTKEDLLDELARRAGEQSTAVITPIVEDTSLSGIEKLNALFKRTNAFKAQNRELMLTLARVFYSDQNALLRARMTRRNIDLTAPILERIIVQGVSEGSMSVAHPKQTAVYVLEFGSSVVSDFARRLADLDNDPSVAEELVVGMQVYSDSVERILGIAPGTLHLVDESMMRMLFAGKGGEV